MSLRQRWDLVWHYETPFIYGMIMILGLILSLFCLVVGIIIAISVGAWFIPPLVAIGLIGWSLYFVKGRGCLIGPDQLCNASTL